MIEQRVSSRYKEIKTQLHSVERGDRVELLEIDAGIVMCLYPSKITNNILPVTISGSNSHHFLGIMLLMLLVVISYFHTNWW